jgi:hypothetical protein
MAFALALVWLYGIPAVEIGMKVACGNLSSSQE